MSGRLHASAPNTGAGLTVGAQFVDMSLADNRPPSPTLSHDSSVLTTSTISLADHPDIGTVPSINPQAIIEEFERREEPRRRNGSQETATLPAPSAQSRGSSIGRPSTTAATVTFLNQGSSISTENVPSLVPSNSSSSMSSSSSLSTTIGLNELQPHSWQFPPDENGDDISVTDDQIHAVRDIAQRQPSVPPLRCPVEFMGKCDEACDNPKKCYRHTITCHLKGKLPPKALCPFENCPYAFKTSAASGEAWKAMIYHLAEHQRAGQALGRRKPDYELYEFLRNNYLLSDADYQELVRNHDRTLPTRPYVEVHKSCRRSHRRDGEPSEPRLIRKAHRRPTEQRP